MDIFEGIPLWIQSGFWGLLSGSALVLGATIGYYFKVPVKVIAMIMSFGSGVLISALSFDLMDEAYKKGGFDSTALGFISGASIFSLLNIFINKKGGKHRKRSGLQQAKAKEKKGSGLAIAMGALLDGIPESIVIGISLISGGVVSITAVIAVFLSNFPEGLSSASGMKNAGRSAQYIFGVWLFIALVSSLASILGFVAFNNVSAEIISAIMAVAAGAILAMLSETMIPEAFEEAHDWVGLITVLGFLCAFILTKWNSSV
jgi:ZIP family zinc transporter